jgi:hypothetical protein
MSAIAKQSFITSAAPWSRHGAVNKYRFSQQTLLRSSRLPMKESQRRICFDLRVVAKCGHEIREVAFTYAHS